MRTQLPTLSSLLVILLLALEVHAQTRTYAQQRWTETLNRMAQREHALNRVYAVASVERSIQRTGEERPTVVTKATARIWADAPKYRVEIENEISLESPRKGMPYTSTGIRRQLITCDGATVCQAIDMENGDRTGIDHGRDYALPIMFAGFPSPDPIRPWAFSLGVDRLLAKQFNCDYLDSGMIRVQSPAPDKHTRNRHVFYLMPDSHEIRRHEVRDSSGKLVSSIDLVWAESREKVVLRRFLRKGNTASSQFPGGVFKDITSFEFLEFQSDVAISDDTFSKGSLGENRSWKENTGGY